MSSSYLAEAQLHLEAIAFLQQGILDAHILLQPNGSFMPRKTLPEYEASIWKHLKARILDKIEADSPTETTWRYTQHREFALFKDDVGLYLGIHKDEGLKEATKTIAGGWAFADEAYVWVPLHAQTALIA